MKQLINDCHTSSIRAKDTDSHHENYYEGVALQYTTNFIKSIFAMTSAQKIVFCSVKNETEFNRVKQGLFSVKPSNEYKKEIATSVVSLRSQ
ncbi:MAG TPA: hypothetical protein VHA52_01300 [Candidatus Babeliaceae bacterium]|nr:hypothetical protein [Candidatus Babeliaceae bacterium]